MADKPKFKTREEWLMAAVVLMTPLFEEKGYKVPEIRVACGWPSSRGLSNKKRVLGECWATDCSEDKRSQIFISPYMRGEIHISRQTDGQGVLPTLVHEVVHAVVGNQEGHNAVFGKCARAVHLCGKLTSTRAEKDLIEICEKWIAKLGPYPHSKLDGMKAPGKKQTTRLVKCQCPKCEYNVRATRKWLEIGAPICPIVGHGPMKFDTDLDFEPDDEGGSDE
jgi:hypothetical protein